MLQFNVGGITNHHKFTVTYSWFQVSHSLKRCLIATQVWLGARS